jgi:hypothetical protein
MIENGHVICYFVFGMTERKYVFLSPQNIQRNDMIEICHMKKRDIIFS